MNREFTLDASRRERTGLDEAIFCAGKSLAQIEAILAHAESAGRRLLLTRLAPADHAALPAERTAGLDYDPVSRTAILGSVDPPADVAAGGEPRAGVGDRRLLGHSRRPRGRPAPSSTTATRAARSTTWGWPASGGCSIAWTRSGPSTS